VSDRSIAIVDPATLLGKELRDRVAERRERFTDVRLLASDEERAGAVTEIGREAAIVGLATEVELSGLAAVIFCDPGARSRELAAVLADPSFAVFLHGGPERVEGEPAVYGRPSAAALSAPLLVSPHPVAIATALLAGALEELGVRSLAVGAVLPVSTDDESALEELFSEARAVLSFEKPPRSRHGEQLAFNLLPAPDVAERAEAELGRLLEGGSEVSVLASRAGVFHGVSLQLHLELERSIDESTLRKRLRAVPALEIARKSAQASPVRHAGGETIVVGETRVLPGGRRVALTAVIDNLVRGGALNALEITLERLESGPAH